MAKYCALTLWLDIEDFLHIALKKCVVKEIQEADIALSTH